MKIVLVFIAFAQGCLCASLTRELSGCPLICPANYAPVCGSDEKSYSNRCALDAAICVDSSISFSYDGECKPVRSISACPPTICIKLYAPVCASNGQTYSNTCVFNGANCNNDMTIVHDGTC